MSTDLSSGALEVRLKFDAKNSKMWVFIVKATLEMSQRFTRPTFIQVHLTMLPNKRIRFRTRAKPADNAMFAEEFFCKVSPGNRHLLFRMFFLKFLRSRINSNARHSFSFIYK